MRWLEGQPGVGDGDYDLFTDKPDDLDFPWSWAAESELARGYEVNGQKVHVIKRPYYGLTEVLNSFDFTARMAGTDGKNLFVGSRTLNAIANKLIERNPDGNFSINVTSLYGIVRYANRGYKINHSEARKMLAAWGVPASQLSEGY